MQAGTSSLSPPMTSPEAAPHTSQELSFQIAKNDAHDNVPILLLEAAWNFQREQWSSETEAAGNGEEPVDHGSSQIENCRTNKEALIAWEVNSTVNQLVTTEFWNMLETSLDGILKTLVPSAQSCISSVFHDFVNLVLLDLQD